MNPHRRRGGGRFGKSATAAERARVVFLLEEPATQEVLAAAPDRLLVEGPVLIDEWQHLPMTWDVVRRAVDAGADPGFPGIRPLPGRVRSAQLRGYIDRVIDREFPELGHPIRNPAALRRWLGAYAAATATNASFEAIRDAATSGQGEKPAKTTALPYRDTLERLYVLDPLPAWLPSTNHISELTAAPKHHLADPALAATLLGLGPDALLRGDEGTTRIQRDGTFLDALFESLVTLSVRVYAQAAEATTSHSRTHRGDHEVDLIVERPDQRVVALETKLAPDRRRRRRQAPALAAPTPRPRPPRRRHHHHRPRGLPPPRRHRRHPRCPPRPLTPASTDPPTPTGGRQP
jgi:hypothetical protein